STIGQVGNLGDSLDSAGTSADKTKKKLQNLLGGFDELNTISFDTSSDSGSSGTGGVGAGASGLDFGSLGNWDGYDLGEPDTSGIVRAAEKVKEVFRNIARFISENKAIILAIIGGLVAGVATYLGIMALGGTVGDVIAAFQLLPVFIAEACSGVIGSVVGLVTGISWPAVAIAAVIAGIVASFIYLWQTSDDFRQSLIEGWNNLVSIITPLVQSVVAIFKTLGDMFWTFLKPIVIIFADFFVTCIDNIVQVVMSFWNNVLAPFVQFFADCVKKLVDGIAEIWASWKPTIEQIGNILIIIWNTTLKPFINWLGGVFIDAFRNLGSYIKPILDDLKRAFSGLVDFITGVLTGNWRKAWQGIVDVFGGVFGGIVDIAKSPLNAVISLVNSAISSLNRISVSIPSWVPGFGGKSFGISIPKIPMLARGGMIGSPTLAMIGEAGYNEAVVPLDRDAKAVSMIAELLAEKMPQGASSGNSDSFGGGDLILMIDGSVIGKVALQQLRKMQRQGNITLIPT
ncbi:phage tail protein, partial [Turicibacter sanguinis]